VTDLDRINPFNVPTIKSHQNHDQIFTNEILNPTNLFKSISFKVETAAYQLDSIINPNHVTRYIPKDPAL